MKKIFAAVAVAIAMVAALVAPASAEPFPPATAYPSGNFHPHPSCGDFTSPTTGDVIHLGSSPPLTTEQALYIGYTYGGFRGSTLRNMVTIAWGESNFCPRAFKNGAESRPQPTNERSFGLWQINATNNDAVFNQLKAGCGPLVSRTDLYYTDKNAKCAKFKLTQAGGYSPWSAYEPSASWWAPTFNNVDAWADFKGW